MHVVRPFSPNARVRQRGLTVMELLVSVAVMSVLVYGLYKMFNHTQRALRANITQVDVLESGRSAMELITRELVELSAAGLSNAANIQVTLIPVPGMMQTELDDRTALRTNVIQEIFFLTRATNQFRALGYTILESGGENRAIRPPQSGIGTLYRYSDSRPANALTNDVLLAGFTDAVVDARTQPGTRRLNRVADGIVHLRMSAYDRYGRPLDINRTIQAFTGDYRVLQVAASAPLRPPPGVAIVARPGAGPFKSLQTEFRFVSNALPSYVELELGVLEAETFKQFQSVRDNASLAAEFLRKRASKVHLFRQRIPIRTAAP